MTLDIHDEIDPASRAWLTTDENGNIVRDEAIQARRDELGVRFEQWYVHNERRFKDEQQKRLIRMVGEYIKANAETVEEFTLAHFSVQPFQSQGGKNWALSVFGDQRLLENLLADMNEIVFSNDMFFDDEDESNGNGHHQQATN